MKFSNIAFLFSFFFLVVNPLALATVLGSGSGSPDTTPTFRTLISGDLGSVVVGATNGGLGQSSAPSSGQTPFGNGSNFTLGTFTGSAGISPTFGSGNWNIDGSSVVSTYFASVAANSWYGNATGSTGPATINTSYLPNSVVNWPSPGTIGSSTPNTIVGTTITGNTSVTSPIVNATSIFTVGNSSDTGMSRNTSGTVEFNDNTAGNWGGLVAENINMQNLSAPTGVSVTTHGTTGSSTWIYAVCACDITGNTYSIASSGATTTSNNGNLTLTSSNYQQISWSAVTHASSYNIYRVNHPGGSSPTSTGLIGNTTSLSFNDTGQAGNGAITPGSLNTAPSTAGDLLWVTDNTADIGANNTHRPRYVFVGTSVVLGSTGTFGQQIAQGVTLTSNHQCSLPNADSNPVQPLNSATAGKFVTNIDANGVQNLAFPSWPSPQSEGGSFSAVTGNWYQVTATATCTLPTASGVTGQEILVENKGSSITVTFNTTSSQLIDYNGTAYTSGTLTSTTEYQTHRFISDGTNWLAEF